MTTVTLLWLVTRTWANDPESAATVAEPAVVDRAGAEAAYLEALAAWNRGEVWIALRRSRAALALDASLAPARLLEGHALMRLGERAAADAAYSLLLNEDLGTDDAPTRAAAERARSLVRQRNARDQLSVFAATELALRPTGEGLSPALGYAAGVGVPLSSLFGVAVEMSAWDASAGDAVVEGPVFDVMGTMAVPFPASPWALRLKAGPAIWLTEGLITGGELVPQFGVRSVLGIDSRTWSFGGWFVETGGWFWPAYMQRLPVLAYTWDVRVGVVAWFGEGRR